MSRIRLQQDSELAPAVLAQVKAMEAAGHDASVSRGLAHHQTFFDAYFKFYYPAHNEGCIEPALKELVRLKIARLNDCFT
ncbi:MAG: hypothetical protein O3A63_05645 [Proteobacteria bacterium]|nr:hypothetical protein [Pseudomonadota bacterium]